MKANKEKINKDVLKIVEQFIKHFEEIDGREKEKEELKDDNSI